MGIWMGINNVWKKDGVEACLKVWYECHDLKKYMILPSLVLWGIWIVRNDVVFDNRMIPTFQVTS